MAQPDVPIEAGVPAVLGRLTTARVGHLAGSVERRLRAQRLARRQRLPRLRTASRPGHPAKVYYLSPDFDTPSGGVHTIYRHVDLLNDAGIPAAVLHRRPGFACSWFDHTTTVKTCRQVELTPSDVLVIPEFYGPTLASVPRGVRVVVFNQSGCLTYRGLPERPVRHGAPYRGLPGLEALLVVSRYSEDYLRFAFPGLRVERIRHGIDPGLFRPATGAPGRRLAFMPRRGTSDTAQVLHILGGRGSLAGWDLLPIDGLSHQETARALRSAAVFLSTSLQEGFGLPAAEAMACGCYVVGYTGLGGREFFDPAHSAPVEGGDVVALARATAEVLREYRERPHSVRARGLAASAVVRHTYTIDNQRRDLVAFFESLLRAEATRDRGARQLAMSTAAGRAEEE